MDKKTQETMFSSKTPEWETPRDLYDRLNESWNFTLDPCCTKETAKCETFFTKDDDGLSQDWQGHRVFMNPPYGKKMHVWLEKAYKEAVKKDTTVVCLVPSRTDTKWFHDYCMKAQSIRFIKGRLKFGNATAGAPFPSMLVIFNGREPATMYGTPTIYSHRR